jgi:hypothetical protein
MSAQILRATGGPKWKLQPPTVASSASPPKNSSRRKMEELLRQSLAMTKEVAFLVANDTFPEDAVEAKNRVLARFWKVDGRSTCYGQGSDF